MHDQRHDEQDYPPTAIWPALTHQVLTPAGRPVVSTVAADCARAAPSTTASSATWADPCAPPRTATRPSRTTACQHGPTLGELRATAVASHEKWSSGPGRSTRCWRSPTVDDIEQQWRRKGATLSDKTARKELGLTQEEIVEAIDAGRLHYRVGSVYGNPWYRLLRSEVEALVADLHGERALEQRRARAELAHLSAELKRLRSEVAALEQRRAELSARLEGG